MTRFLTGPEKGMDRHWQNYMGRNYLGAYALEPDEEMLLTIANFAGEEMVHTPDGLRPKPVLYFKERVPKMVLNVTNGNILASLYGPRPANWLGKQIQICLTQIKISGKVKDSLRIRSFVPRPLNPLTSSL